MNTKNLVIFGAGVLTGYLLTQFFAGKIQGVTPPSTEPAVIGSAGNVPDMMPSQAEADCSAKMMEAMATMRFGSDADMESYKTQFMSDCLAGK
jgi:hypothetical protein